jgi:hypothetical protein
MSNPDNSAARNTMSEFERQCYDWGFEDAEERIIKLLETQAEVTGYVEIELGKLIALIKNFGESKEPS